eukprot:537516-Rhodomonas_salina.1
MGSGFAPDFVPGSSGPSCVAGCDATTLLRSPHARRLSSSASMHQLPTTAARVRILLSSNFHICAVRPNATA